MSPRAAELLREDESLSFADLSDYVVGLVVVVLGLVFLGYGIAVYQYENQRFECPTMLPDGRDLIARHLGERGDEKCTYADPRPMKKPTKGEAR